MIMAKRTPYRAAIVGDGLTDQQTTTYAMNSAIRTSEALVRDLARSEGVIYHGALPARVGDVYTRVWTSDRGRTVTAQAPDPMTVGRMLRVVVFKTATHCRTLTR
jgi:hypothetical protein